MSSQEPCLTFYFRTCSFTLDGFILKLLLEQHLSTHRLDVIACLFACLPRTLPCEATEVQPDTLTLPAAESWVLPAGVLRSYGVAFDLPSKTIFQSQCTHGLFLSLAAVIPSTCFQQFTYFAAGTCSLQAAGVDIGQTPVGCTGHAVILRLHHKVQTPFEMRGLTSGARKSPSPAWNPAGPAVGADRRRGPPPPPARPVAVKGRLPRSCSPSLGASSRQAVLILALIPNTPHPLFFLNRTHAEAAFSKGSLFWSGLSCQQPFGGTMVMS